MSRTQNLLIAALLLSSGTAFAADKTIPSPTENPAQVPARLRREQSRCGGWSRSRLWGRFAERPSGR